MPTIPRVPKCCCCLSLNTGGLVLGWMGAIGSVLILLILSSILFIDYDEYVTEHFKDDREMLEQFLKFKPIVITSAIVIAIVYIIHLVVSILLIRGTMNRVASFIKPWLIMEAIGCVLMFLGLLASLATPEHIVPNALSLGLSVYLWICVYSLFKFIQSEDYNQQMAYNPGMQKV